MRPRTALRRTLTFAFIAAGPALVPGQSFTLLSGWPQANGIVHCMSLDQSNGLLYLGGDFTTVDGQPRDRLAAIDIGTGALTAWAPSANSSVRAIVARGDSVFIGGNFTMVNGQSQPLLAALDRTTGALSPWAPLVNGAVLCMLGDAGTLYVGGSFTTINGQTRNRLAAFDSGVGALTAWDPNAGSQVNQLAWNGTNVLAAGIFPSVGGATRFGLAELDPGTGAATSWVANTNAVATAVGFNGNRVFAGGQFTSVNGTARQGMAELNSISGTVEPWTATIDGGVRALAFSGNVVFAGGFFSTVNGAAHTHLAAIDAATGSLFPGSPSASSTVNCMIADQGKLYVAGVFTLVNGSMPRDRFAVFSYCSEETWFADTDADGLGDAGNTVMACEVPAGFVDNDDDCDDQDENVGLGEIWYPDADGDEYGAQDGGVTACSQPAGFADNNLDCDDLDETIFPFEPCEDNDAFTTSDQLRPFPECGCRGNQLVISARAMLEGAYDIESGLMRDDLRVAGLVPLSEPYTALGYVPAPGSVAGGDTVDPPVLTITGPDAIVDWVILEVRRIDNVQAEPVSTRYVLIQRDGDIVEPDGISAVRFPLSPANYRLAVVHRNHMGILEAWGINQNGSYYEVTSRDFTSASFEMEGNSPRAQIGNTMLLRAGDTSFNDDALYVGFGNDRDPILARVGGSVPTATTTGYFTEDVNLDGVVKYTGSGNDRDPILVTIGGSIPTNVRQHTYRNPTY